MASIALTTQEYLRTISPLAQKVSEDVKAAKDAYQDLWDSLDYAQQQQVLDETIIDPSAVLKYTAHDNQKINWNEDFESNFSWFTKSQLNLFTNLNLKNNKPKKIESFSPVSIKTSITDSANESSKKSYSDSTNLLNKLKSKVNILKSSTTQEEKKNLVDKVQINIVPKGVISKPKTPPPPPPSRYSGNEHTEKSALLGEDAVSNHGDEIPKTGFDFLDNW